MTWQSADDDTHILQHYECGVNIQLCMSRWRHDKATGLHLPGEKSKQFEIKERVYGDKETKYLYREQRIFFTFCNSVQSAIDIFRKHWCSCCNVTVLNFGVRNVFMFRMYMNKPTTLFLTNNTFAFYVYGSVHRWSTLIIVQRDATQSSLFIILRVHSTCFGCQQYP